MVDSKIVVVVEKSVVGMIVVVKLSSHSHSKSKLYMIEKKYEKIYIQVRNFNPRHNIHFHHQMKSLDQNRKFPDFAI